AYVALILWVGREHFGHIIRRAFGLARAEENEKTEPLSYPVAFWGFILSFAFIIAWCVAAGIRWDVACALWGCYLVIAIALTRVVVEGGLLFVQHGWMPLGAMSQLIGSGPGAWLVPSTIVPASFVQTAMMHDLRGFLLPSFVQSFKLAHDRGIKPRPLLALITAVTLITLVMGIVMRVRLGYLNGGLSLNPWSAVAGPKWPPRLTQEIIKGASDAGWINWAWLGVGVAVTYCLMLARSRFLWFTLHPIGYLVGLTYSMNMLWFSVFLGWLCKVLIMRFGGVDIYRRATATFLGLILGDVFMMLFWLIIDGWQGRTMHQLMPG
ncbi:MAG TPA: DUF6785 family protein, partial [Abditibacteriaceae bacterium]|nr:DUF6785 family protein [Abditibacteriaceae bacterium]